MQYFTLKEAREDRGITQQEEADMLGISLETYQEWEELQPFLDILTFVTMASDQTRQELQKRIQEIKKEKLRK